MGIFDDFNQRPRQRRYAGSVTCASGEPLGAPGNRRIIQTARTVETINEATEKGFRPLVKPVQPNPEVHFRLTVVQSSKTGKIELLSNARSWPRYRDGARVIDLMYYYPYHFPSPFAAYLLPSDLVAGEEVWLEDLIEDLVAEWGAQGDNPRLEAAPAIWNGEDFEILFDPERDANYLIG